MPESQFLKELIIENFMSYKYARIFFKPGLNLIVGPNGSGKSSILLALSVALGQTYTERSRKLSELIRWGEEYARITVRLDNTPRDGSRAFPRIKRDEVVITRYLRRDGMYSFEINYRDAAKAEVLALLREVGINPDNSLIIMHQNMIENFGVVDAKQKLLLFEEAVGLKEYRERIVEARDKLSSIINEEKELRRILDETEGTLAKYREEYNKLMRKRSLIERKNELYKEYVWSRYHRLNNEYNNLLNKLSDLKEDLDDNKKLADRFRFEAENIRVQISRLYNLVKELFEEAQSLSYLVGKGEIDEYKLEDLSVKLNQALGEISSNIEKYVNRRVNESISNFKVTLIEREIRQLDRKIRELEDELNEVKSEANSISKPIYTNRSPIEIFNEMREIEGMLKMYRDVDDEVEDTYKYYRGIYHDIKSKMDELAKNKVEASKELDRRIQLWRKKLIGITSEISNEYNRLLSGIDARGYARIIGIENVDEAGLELIVGFKGGEERILDAYVQSGGERTTAIMMFLLALQGFIKSPLRAVDEFDVHMDPRNREIIMNYLINIVNSRGGQYLVITPGYLSGLTGDINVIMVQKTGEYSLVSTVKRHE